MHLKFGNYVFYTPLHQLTETKGVHVNPLI